MLPTTECLIIRAVTYHNHGHGIWEACTLSKISFPIPQWNHPIFQKYSLIFSPTFHFPVSLFHGWLPPAAEPDLIGLSHTSPDWLPGIRNPDDGYPADICDVTDGIGKLRKTYNWENKCIYWNHHVGLISNKKKIIIINYYYLLLYKKYWLANFLIIHIIHPSIRMETGSIRIVGSRGRLSETLKCSA